MKVFATWNLICDIIETAMNIMGELGDNKLRDMFVCHGGIYLIPTTYKGSLFLWLQSITSWIFIFIVWYTYYKIPVSMSVITVDLSKSLFVLR